MKLKINVPKRVRSELRAIADNSGTTVDEIVSQALWNGWATRRRW